MTHPRASGQDLLKEAIAEQLKHIRADVDRLQARLNWLFALILGTAESAVINGADPLQGLRW